MKKLVRRALPAALSLFLSCGCAFAVKQDSLPPVDKAEYESAAEESEQGSAAEGISDNRPLLDSLENVIGGDEWEWYYNDSPDMIVSFSGQPQDHAGGWLKGAGSFGALEGGFGPLEGGYKPDVCLRQYLSDGRNVPVYYFQTSFLLEEGAVETYSADIIDDDSVIVRLNGENIFEGNVPEDGYDAAGYGYEKLCGEPLADTITLDKKYLKAGVNELTVELHQANEESSDIYFQMGMPFAFSESLGKIRNDTVCLGIGENEGQVLVTWQGAGSEGHVEAAEKPKDAAAFEKAVSDFPSSAKVYPAEMVYENEWGTNTFRAVISGLEPGREYMYRVADEAVSDVFCFSCAEEGSFSFVVSGDPQIADAFDAHPMENYERLFKKAAEDGAPSFLLTLGDQADQRKEELYMNYISTELTKSYPTAAIVGNHDNDSDLFSRFFYMPHMDEDTVFTSGDMSGDYWFYQYNTLFLCLNSNNDDAQGHEEFLKRAKAECIEQYGKPRWIIAAFHHALFSSGDHALSDTTLEKREELVPLLEEAGVDVVLNGHDHAYVRSFQMNGTEPIISDAAKAINPEGIVYFTLSSSTGSKYYDMAGEEFDYVAKGVQNYRPSMARVDITDSSFSIKVYYKTEEGEIELLDSYAIYKE